MAKGGGVGYKRKTRNKVRLENKGSDDSDEDYNIDEDEFGQSEDEYCSSLAEDDSDESLGEFDEEEEELVEKKVTRPRGRKNLQARKYNGVVKPRRKKVSYKEEDDEDEEEDYSDDDFTDVNRRMNNGVVKHRRKMISYNEEEEEEDSGDDDALADVKHRKKIKVSHKEKEDHDSEILHGQNEDEFVDEQLRIKSDVYVDTCNENPRKKNKVTYLEGKEDGNTDDDDDDVDDEDDEEFTPSEVLKETRSRKPVRKPVTRRSNRSGEVFRDGNSDDLDDEDEEDSSKENEVSYREGNEDGNSDDEDDGEFTPSEVLKGTRRKKPVKKQVTRRSNRSEEEFREGNSDDLDGEDDENPRKKKEVSYQEGKEDGDSDDLDDEDDEEFSPSEVLKGTRRRKPVKKQVTRRNNRSGEEFRDSDSDSDDLDGEDDENPRKKNEVSDQEGKEDGNSDDLDDEGDEEFTPSEVLKGARRRKPVQKQVTRRNNRSGLSKEFRDENPTSRKRKTMKGRRSKVVVNSDSDFVSSESDFEYSVSEEERQQAIEADEFRRRLTKRIKEEDLLPPQRKFPARKGKEKIVTTKIELVKQVCGICLSEEGKRTVKGVLNCCSHYFCFACIMEWSKVESRCPLCKQRFTTISRSTRVDGGNDLRDAVFPVPERDQVYQPSEEELRGFLDPYENVLCTECQQGGEDAFMLLCDLCDSPAHTFCVGLGREVPDGNWYCDGCRPTLASSNGQTMNPTPDHGASNNLSISSSPVPAARETFDLNEVYVPDTPLAEHSQSPRNSIGETFTSSGYGSGAFTLYERRRIQRQIHQMLHIRSRQSERSDGVGPLSGISFFGSPIGRPGVIAPQPGVMPARMAPQNIYLNGRLQEYNNSHSVFSPGLSLREQALHNQASTSTNHSFGGLLSGEFGGINARLGGGFGHQQLHTYGGRSNTGSDASTSPYQFREATVPSRTLQGSFQPF